MKKFRLEILTPTGVYLDKEVEELYLKTSSGYLGIMANHDTYLTSVEIGAGFILSEGKRDYYVFFDGVLNITKKSVKLILSNIESEKNIILSRATSSKDRAEKRLRSSTKEKVDILRAKRSLERAKARINCIEKKFI